ncbi:MAG: hypothetical protein LBL58_01860 [Tannerellaceae bacterium]|jgi:hypothetical protein|nr:hypothetical protein [Tannerellaceae bacterium]
MNNLRFDRTGQFFQPELPAAHQSTMFRYYTLEENQLFKVDNKEFVHFFFLSEGEIRISGVKSTKSVITSKEFFFIPNNRFICRSIKESKFILFSINRFHYQVNNDLYADIIPVITALRERHSPQTTPPLLSLFVEILTGYLKDGFDNEHLQTLKQKELFIILQALYTEGYDNDLAMYGRLSLS